MGIYLNPNNEKYAEMLRGEVFVDHSLLIEKTNPLIRTPNKMLCVSRPRRFGKSTDANMLTAYYSKGCDSTDIFNDLKLYHFQYLFLKQAYKWKEDYLDFNEDYTYEN